MTINQRLEALRKEMTAKGLDAYIIPSADPHQSEYVAEHWKCRAWISGFTGSAGTFVITMKESGLWTDGRYFIQAENQLRDSEIQLFKMGEPKVPNYVQYLETVLLKGQCIGFDNKVFSSKQEKDLEAAMTSKGIKINGEFDCIDVIWEDRPSIPPNKVFTHATIYAGKSTEEKLDLVRKEMDKDGISHYLLSSLDDIAWLYNIRGNDMSFSPVVHSYSIISRDKALLFIDKSKLAEADCQILRSNGVELKDYEAVECVLNELDDESILFDPNKTNAWLSNAIPASCKKVQRGNITTDLKAVKNETEIKNLRMCHLKDGVALVKFTKWLQENIGKEEITEISAAQKLEQFRGEQENFIGPSFASIAGYKEHAAMMHYIATEETQYKLDKEGMFLIDSGGQYLDGTTDTTRTIVLGTLSSEELEDFTLVLKGHIALSKLKFLYGATGTNLDIIARQPLWEKGINYNCGTGHGVGFLLNVHEGPHGLSQKIIDVKLEKGMIITNEPGIYKEGRHGIRIENTILVEENEKTEFGQFMSFDTISYCPIDLRGIAVDMLNEEEKKWLNTYHKKVYDTLSVYLTEEEKEWLRAETRAV